MQTYTLLLTIFRDIKSTINLITTLIDKATADATTPLKKSNLRKIHANISQAEEIVDRVLEADNIDSGCEEQLLAAYSKVRDTITDSIRQLDEEIVTLDDILMNRIDQIITDNIDNEEFGVTILASELQLAVKQIYRKIKKITGMPPVGYIRHKRLQVAASLLHQRRYTVSEIMYRVGFSNASYFTRCFIHEYGVSPSEYSSRDITA